VAHPVTCTDDRLDMFRHGLTWFGGQDRSSPNSPLAFSNTDAHIQAMPKPSHRDAASGLHVVLEQAIEHLFPPYTSEKNAELKTWFEY
jgi:hypothetical protein